MWLDKRNGTTLSAKVVKKMKSTKATGQDNTPVEALKSLHGAGIEKLTQLM